MIKLVDRQQRTGMGNSSNTSCTAVLFYTMFMQRCQNSHLVKCYNMIFGAIFEREIWRRKDSCGRTRHQQKVTKHCKPTTRQLKVPYELLNRYVLKKQTHTHIKVLQGSIIDHFTCNKTFCTSTTNGIACMLEMLKEQYCAVRVACLQTGFEEIFLNSGVLSGLIVYNC